MFPLGSNGLRPAHIETRHRAGMVRTVTVSLQLNIDEEIWYERNLL